MTFEQFKASYQKEAVEEYPHERNGLTPLITIKVLAYNHAAFITECLDSILMQKTDFDFEILLAEDNSSDGTREICIKYAQQFPDKIRLFLNSRKNNISMNGKPSGLFNSVYANYMMTSKYVTMCEGDDYWTDDTSLNKKVSFLEAHDEYVMAFSNFNRLISATGEIQIRPAIKHTKNTAIPSKDILSANIQTVSNVFRNNLIDRFDPKMLDVLLGDMILKGKLSQFGKAYYIHDINPDIYRIHSNGIFSTTSRWQQAQETIAALEYLIDYFQERVEDKRNISTHLIYFCVHTFLRSLIIDRKFNFVLIQKAKKVARCMHISIIEQSVKAFISIVSNYIHIRKSKSNTKI